MGNPKNARLSMFVRGDEAMMKLVGLDSGSDVEVEFSRDELVALHDYIALVITEMDPT